MYTKVGCIPLYVRKNSMFQIFNLVCVMFAQNRRRRSRSQVHVCVVIVCEEKETEKEKAKEERYYGDGERHSFVSEGIGR